MEKRAGGKTTEKKKKGSLSSLEVARNLSRSKMGLYPSRRSGKGESEEKKKGLEAEGGGGKLLQWESGVLSSERKTVSKSACLKRLIKNQEKKTKRLREKKKKGIIEKKRGA